MLPSALPAGGEMFRKGLAGPFSARAPEAKARDAAMGYL